MAGQAKAADGWPRDKPIMIVVPFGAGSGSEVNARFYAKALKETLNANAVVLSKPGAAGMIGAGFVAKAAPDGYTVLMGSGTANAANYAIYKDSISYKPEQLSPVAMLYVSPVVLFTTKDREGKSVKQFLTGSTGNVNCGSGNTVTEVACEMIKLRSNADTVTVQYKGTAQSLLDLVAGRLSVSFADMAAAMPFLSNGSVRAVAISGNEHLPTLEGVKTFAEQGIPDFDFRSWNGLFVPAGTPPEAIKKLNKAAQVMLASPEWEQQRKQNSGLKVDPSLEYARQFVANEIALWNRYAEETGIKK
ncbi:Bug family tripartite tricarboxylate transporter substrate binding protein [Allopusillimonas ginsengisoli]|uniref:Bug family tripartite tricarboxylate transporter substrate binding protein n=1 Tax=Allopusillimonas ginsengisoli TaxID=453575 RepID=UPI00143158C5|nr:tripartite tricarboxylate transporter substrate binding protein [Allopusillimonas ginsengisoli]